MYSPTTPCGPDRVVMNRISTFCWAGAGPAARSAAAKPTATALGVLFPMIPSLRLLDFSLYENRPLIGQCGLDREPRRQDALVLARKTDHHQPHRCRPGRVDRQRQRASVEEIDQAGVAQHVAVRQAESLGIA